MRTSRYTYATYQAAARGLLLPWPPRDRLLAEFADGALRELYLGAQLNAWLSFNDLWSYMRYEHYSTIYNNLIGAARGRCSRYATLPIRAVAGGVRHARLCLSVRTVDAGRA